MDLKVFAAVLWRFRVLMGVGVLVAATVAAISYVRVDFNGGMPTLKYRQPELWVSFSRIQLEPASEAPTVSGDQIPTAQSRLLDSTILYARLIDSDAVMQIMRKSGPAPDDKLLKATPLNAVEGNNNSGLVPIINVAGLGPTPKDSLELAGRGAHALSTYIASVERDVPLNLRIKTTLVNQPGDTQLWAARRRTAPIIAFLTVMFAIVGLSFILENIRPRVRSVPGVEGIDAPPLDEARRRSA